VVNVGVDDRCSLGDRCDAKAPMRSLSPVRYLGLRDGVLQGV